MVKDTALMAIRIGSNTFINGEASIVAVDIPNKEVIGLAHTPMQAPFLQQENKIGNTELKLPVSVSQSDFNLFILYLYFTNYRQQIFGNSF